MSVFEGEQKITYYLLNEPKPRKFEFIEMINDNLDDITQTKLLLKKEIGRLKEIGEQFQSKIAELSKLNHYQNLINDENNNRKIQQKIKLQSLIKEVNELKLETEGLSNQIQTYSQKDEMKENEIQEFIEKINYFEIILRNNNDEHQELLVQINQLQDQYNNEKEKEIIITQEINSLNQESNSKNNNLSELLLKIRTQKKYQDEKNKAIVDLKQNLQNIKEDNIRLQRNIISKKEVIQHLNSIKLKIKGNIQSIKNRLIEENQKKNELGLKQQESQKNDVDQQQDISQHDRLQQTLIVNFQKGNKFFNQQEQERFSLQQKLKEINWMQKKIDQDFKEQVQMKNQLSQFIEKPLKLLENFQIQNDLEENIRMNLDESSETLQKLKKIVFEKKQLYFKQFQQ